MATQEAVSMPTAVMKLGSKPDGRAKRLKNILASCTGNPALPAVPNLAGAQASCNAYDKAATQAQSKAPADITARQAAWVVAKGDAEQILAYVQGAANKAGNPAAAAEIIVNAGMSVKKVTKRVKPPFAAKNIVPVGSVKLEALRVALQAMYYWCWSQDQKTWTSVTETMQASTIITGLTPGQTYYFRFTARTRAGALDVSQVISLMVA
jgi:hypothetical protein